MSDDGKRIAQARDAANMAIQELSRWAFCHLGERDEALAEVERLHGIVADGDEALARSVLAEKEARAEVKRLTERRHECARRSQGWLDKYRAAQAERNEAQAEVARLKLWLFHEALSAEQVRALYDRAMSPEDLGGIASWVRASSGLAADAPNGIGTPGCFGPDGIGSASATEVAAKADPCPHHEAELRTNMANPAGYLYWVVNREARTAAPGELCPDCGEVLVKHSCWMDEPECRTWLDARGRRLVHETADTGWDAVLFARHGRNRAIAQVERQPTELAALRALRDAVRAKETGGNADE